jgi:hypothetical protein
MALVKVDNDGTGGFRSNSRWSAGKRADVALRVLRGEKLDEVSREICAGE